MPINPSCQALNFLSRSGHWAYILRIVNGCIRSRIAPTYKACALSDVADKTRLVVRLRDLGDSLCIVGVH